MSKPASKRSVRVADQIKMEVADILARKCKDPRLRFVTVTDVAINNDLRKARVSVALLEHQGEEEDVIRTLNNAAGFVRLELGRRLELRYTPEVTFWFDSSEARAAEIGRLLDDVLLLDDEAERDRG